MTRGVVVELTAKVVAYNGLYLRHVVVALYCDVGDYYVPVAWIPST